MGRKRKVRTLKAESIIHITDEMLEDIYFVPPEELATRDLVLASSRKDGHVEPLPYGKPMPKEPVLEWITKHLQTRHIKELSKAAATPRLSPSKIAELFGA